MRYARRIPWLILLSLLFSELAAFAQIYPGGNYPPGGYPGGGYPPGVGYPGGGYPGGYPGGGVGIPMPGRRKKETKKEDTQPLLTVTGMLRKLDEKQLVIEAEDTRLISLKRTTKTKFLKKDGDDMKPSDLKPGDHVEIEATQNEEGYYTAVNVNFEKAGSAAERAAASREVEMSTQASEGHDSDDDERPRLRRAGSPPPAEAPVAEAPRRRRSPQARRFRGLRPKSHRMSPCRRLRAIRMTPAHPSCVAGGLPGREPRSRWKPPVCGNRSGPQMPVPRWRGAQRWCHGGDASRAGSSASRSRDC
jgi:Predicted membrane protein